MMSKSGNRFLKCYSHKDSNENYLNEFEFSSITTLDYISIVYNL